MAKPAEYLAFISCNNGKTCKKTCIGQVSQWPSLKNILHWSAELIAMGKEYSALIIRANGQVCKISCIGQLSQWPRLKNILHTEYSAPRLQNDLHWSTEPMAMHIEYYALISRANGPGCKISCSGQLSQWPRL
jgi:hypothetical protein